MNDGIIINGVKHKLVHVEDKTEFYCNTCSLRYKCLMKRFPCHIFGASTWWHFEVVEEEY